MKEYVLVMSWMSEISVVKVVSSEFQLYVKLKLHILTITIQNWTLASITLSHFYQGSFTQPLHIHILVYKTDKKCLIHKIQ